VLNSRQFGRLANQVRTPGAGATVNTNTGEEKSSGWAVATPGAEHVTEPRDVTGGSLRRYTQEHSEALSKPGAHLGLWNDPRERQVYHDVSTVHPNSYAGGAAAIAQGYEPHAGNEPQKSVYNMDRRDTAYMRPANRSEKAETRTAMHGLRKQQLFESPPGRENVTRRVASMSTKKLGAELRNRHP